ncbi:MAG: hypothetical protein M3R58_01335 [Pseudomonadota bacterium]|nr:hypothetical protein [Pseudomonadota bacterium]
MRSPIAALLLSLGLLLAGCSEPIPPEKIAYAGEWRGENVQLVITPGGAVQYERRQGASNVSVNAPIQRFVGDNFVVGIGPFNTTFVVSKPPHLVEGQYRMVVDGVELTRTRAFEGTRV